ncbi:MAG: Holliday junction resolvase RuvX [Muribaculaceae bacterium]|nr:Holliday junction resolvase RuvX [Muribaculaceae bacterium]CCX48788.1 putative Holliday junction resolvase [Bacteroides sp. CAG:927]
MGRLLAIDYGRRRCGIAVTDTLRIVATGLATVPTAQLNEYVKRYMATEQVDAIIVGLPRTVHGEESESMRYIRPGIQRLKQALPGVKVEFFDERFTSVLAHRSMLDSGMKKMQRRDKAVVDEIAATIILNDYLQSKQYQDQ